MTNRILIYFGQVVLLNGVIKNRGAKWLGFFIEFKWYFPLYFIRCTWTICRLIIGSLPAGKTGYPERSNKKTAERSGVFFCCGVERHEPLRVERGWWQKGARGHECEWRLLISAGVAHLFVYGYRLGQVLDAVRKWVELSEWNVRGFIGSILQRSAEQTWLQYAERSGERLVDVQRLGKSACSVMSEGWNGMTSGIKLLPWYSDAVWMEPNEGCCCPEE
jgi:hypothetical protein